MADMIKFFKGLEASLPASGVNGALYITTDEGAIYLGTGTGMKRLGDFVQVDNVAALPEKAHESCLYYCVAENILAKWNGTEWKQINKQPTAEEMKTLLGLGSMAYKAEVAEANLNADLAAKINAASGAQHSHDNKTVLDGITAEKVAAWDSAEANAIDHADGLNTAMNTRVEAVEAAIGENGSVATKIKTAIEALDFTDTAVDGEYVSAVNEVDGKISVTRKALPDYSETYDAKGAAATALDNAKAYADGLAANYDEKGAAAGVKTELEAEIAKKVDKESYDADKATFATKTELGDVDKKFENYRTSADQDVIDNGHKERIEALEAKFTGDNSVDAKIAAAVDAEKQRAEGIEGGLRTDVNAVAGRMDTAEGKITALETESAKHALKTEVEAVDAKFADYVTSASYATDKQATETALADRYTKEEADGKFALIADAYDDTELVGRVSALETESAKHAVKTEVDAALDLKADKSVVEAMYTNEQIDGFIADAKKYADDNDANTTYTIGYESKVDGEGGHPARIVFTPSEGEAQYIDATPFIKDSVLDNVTYDADTNTLTFTFNTDAGKEAVTVELTDILAPYTGSTGDRVKIEVTDGVISADLVAGSIGKDYLDESVKASLALADSAIQSHQDISHLATTEALNGVDAKFANYTNTTDMNAKFDLKADKTQVATDIATAKSGAEAEAARLDGVLKSELQGEINTKANTADVYAKTETFTKDEVNAAIAAAVEAAHTWGEF